MGRNKRKPWQNKGGGNRQARDNGDNRGYPSLVKENWKLQKYYDTLLELPEDEKVEFWEALRRELPNSFRFAGSKGHALAVRRIFLTRYIPELEKISHTDGTAVSPPKPVPWYPDELAWSMTTSRQVVRKYPPFAAFKKFLVSETEVGNISRQEVVSMIPPLFLDVRPGMAVLDLCAAPGSKSAQLLEMLHVGEEARIHKVMTSLGGVKREEGEDEGGAPPPLDFATDPELAVDPTDDGRATGLLIANDVDPKRAHLLVHQLKRLSSPNLLVTTHDATVFPSIKLPAPPGDKGGSRVLRFDRILADVPCTGDGTMRKNVNLWRDWNPSNAPGLHAVQVRILVRALQLLKVGGRVVYSTCSMNPVENEAVIAAAVERCGGTDAIEVLDCADRFPLLKRRPGLTTWRVMDKAANVWSSYKELVESGQNPGKLTETMFPPADGQSDVPLERCMRVYAHLQDTGGFFIVALEKKTEFRAKPEGAPQNGNKRSAAEASTAGTAVAEETAAPKVEANGSGLHAADEKEAENGEDRAAKKAKVEEGETKPEEADAATFDEAAIEEHAAADITAPAPAPSGPDYRPRQQGSARQQAAQRQPGGGKKETDSTYEEPFKYLAPDHEVIANIFSFYDMSPRFPRDRFMVRNAIGEPAKGVYFTSGVIRDILTENEGRVSGGSGPPMPRLRCIHGGLRVFVRQEAPSVEVCRWRIQSEGMPFLAGYVGPGRTVTTADKETLRRLLIEMFPLISGSGWTVFPDIGERVRDMGMGCAVLRVEPHGDDPDFSERMSIPLWKSFQSLNLMLPKEDRSAMLLRIFNDTTPLVNTTHRKEKLIKAEAELKAEAEVKAEEDVDVKIEAGEDGVVKEEGGDVEAAEEDDDIKEEADVMEGIEKLDGDVLENAPSSPE